MKFSDKLKKLRTDNKLTQDQLAEKLFVTRTAISKWETDKGYPGIDSLKQISNLFKISVDDLISDEDIKNKNIIEKQKSKKMYCLAMISFALTIIFAIFVAKYKYFYIPTFICMASFLIFALLSKRKSGYYTSKQNVKYIIARIVVLIIFIVVISFTMFEIL